MTVWDPSDWATIGHLETDVPSDYGFQSTNTDLQMRYVLSIAQNGGEDLDSGSYMLNQRVRSAYLLEGDGPFYNVGDGLMNHDRTDCFGRYPTDSTVSYSWNAQYYDVDVSIDLR